MALLPLVVRVYVAMVGLVFSALGLALLFDFKGFASRHAKLTRAMTVAIAPRWPWHLSERSIRVMDRAVGAVFAAVGLVVLIGSPFWHITVD
jgi:hypothetical protein